MNKKLIDTITGEELFQPELGQFINSNSGWFEIPLSNDVADAIFEIGNYLDLNKLCSGNPCSNCGQVFECPTFSIRSYCWCEGDIPGHENGCPPNFKYKNFEVVWYKQHERGASQNRNISKKELLEMFDDCMNAIEKEKEK